MISGIVYFSEIIEGVKDATGIENLKPYYSNLRRAVFKAEGDIGAGGMIVRKKASFVKGDANYDGKNIIMPEDFVGESSYFSLAGGVLNGNLLSLYEDGPNDIDLNYLGFLTDSQGNPFTTRNHLDAVVAYAVYRFYSRKVFLGNGSANVYKMYQQEFNDYVLDARGQDAFPTEEQWADIGFTLMGGTFEAMTDCGMNNFDKGSLDPTYMNVAASQKLCDFVAKIIGVTNGTSSATTTAKVITLVVMTASSNSSSIVTGTAWDKNTLKGTSNGATNIVAVLLSSTLGSSLIVGVINGTSEILGTMVSTKNITVRTLGVSEVTGTLRIKAVVYSYTGIYDYPDNVHPLGGQVRYLDQNGVEQLEQGIWSGDIINITAISILWKTGVVPL